MASRVTVAVGAGVCVAAGCALAAYLRFFRVDGVVENTDKKHGGQLVMQVLKEHG